MADDIKESFTRQRRNLLVMLGVIFLTYYWNLDFKTINLIGNEATLGDTRNVYPVLWALLIYWYWRYESLLNDLGDLRIREAYTYRRNRVFEAWLKKAGPMKRIHEKALEFHDLTGLDTRQMRFDGPYIEQDTLFLSAYLVDPMYKRKNSTSWEKRRLNMTLSKPESLWVSLKTVIYLVFKTHLFSEYYLPRLLTWLFLLYWLLCEIGPDLLK